MNRVILTWNTHSTSATRRISDILHPRPATGLKPLGENTVVADRGYYVDK